MIQLRTIKFRGKRIDNGEWVFGNLVLTDREGEYACRIYPFANSEFAPPVIPETVGEFINITQGRDEFYEGDTCKDRDGNIFLINWGAGALLAYYPQTDDYKSIIKVFSGDVERLGNIHDNPSLLSE